MFNCIWHYDACNDAVCKSVVFNFDHRTLMAIDIDISRYDEISDSIFTIYNHGSFTLHLIVYIINILRF